MFHRSVAMIAFSLLLCVQAFSFGGVSPPDPYLLADTSGVGYVTYRQTLGLSVRSPTINPAKKTLVLLTGGQSLGSDVTPTLFTPTNSTVVDQLNIHDGQLYSVGGPLLGSTLNQAIGSPGYSNIFTRLADTFVTNTTFDRVILVVTNVGSTTASMWGDTGGIHANRLTVAMKRLAVLGITPGMTGVTFGCIFDLGEQDLINGTSQAAMTASLNGVISTLQATGFNGLIFVPLESAQGASSNNVRSAQAAVVTGNVKAGGDFDAIGNRADGTHWNDTGAAQAATALYNAMHATGAPY